MAVELGLSSSQSASMLSILTDEDQRREALLADLRSGQAFDRQAMREGVESLRETTLAAVAGVLSSDQYEAFERSTGGFGFGFGPGRGGPGR